MKLCFHHPLGDLPTVEVDGIVSSTAGPHTLAEKAPHSATAWCLQGCGDLQRVGRLDAGDPTHRKALREALP